MIVFAYIGAAIGLVVYIWFCRKIYVTNDSQGLSVASILLWGMLDAIATVTDFLTGGAWQLQGSYVLCCIAGLYFLLRIGAMKWTRVENLTSLLVAVCIILWATLGKEAGLVASVTAVGIATIPQGFECWKEPSKSALWIYIWFAIANTIAIAGGKDWSVAERGYQTVSAVATTILVAIMLYRLYLPRKAASS